MSSFLGMIGTGDWTNEERPKNFRQGLLKMYPNGNMPITAITSKGKSERTDDPEFKYYSKDLAVQGGSITGVYTDLAMTAAAGAGIYAVGQNFYVKVNAETASHFRRGHTALFVSTTNRALEAFGKVISVTSNGDNSQIGVILRAESAASTMNAVNYIDIVGNSNPEGGTAVDSINYTPNKFYNYTQIFRTPLDISRTQRKTRMRTGDPYLEAKADSMLYHGIEIEMALINGWKTEISENGSTERTTQGLIPFLRENEPGNILDYASSTSLTWRQGGEDWLDEKLEVLFRYGRETKMAVCGSGALLGIMKLVKMSGQFQLTPETGAYGVKVARWVTPFGELLLKRHPLFTFKSYRRQDMLIFEPENLRYMYIDDTHFKRDDEEAKAGKVGYDGTKEEFLTEAGFEIHFPETMMLLTSIGSNGTA